MSSKNSIHQNDRFFREIGDILLSRCSDNFLKKHPEEADVIKNMTQEFAQYLESTRINVGLSESELAEKANLSEAEIIALEEGLILPNRIKTETLYALAEVLDIDPEDFALILGREIPKPQPNGNTSQHSHAAVPAEVDTPSMKEHLGEDLWEVHLLIQKMVDSGQLGKTVQAKQKEGHAADQQNSQFEILHYIEHLHKMREFELISNFFVSYKSDGQKFSFDGPHFKVFEELSTGPDSSDRKIYPSVFRLITNREQERTPVDIIQVLRLLYSNTERVVIQQELGGGFSGARVFLVQPLNRQGERMPRQVVKIGPRIELRNEYNNTNQIDLPLIVTRTDRYVEWQELAGITYSFMGDGPFLGRTRTLEDYYQDASEGQIIETLTSLLDEALGKNWYAQSEPYTSLFAEEYSQHLVEHLRLRLRPASEDGIWPAEQVPAFVEENYNRLSGETIRQTYQKILPGELVQIPDWVISKVKHNELTLQHPYHPDVFVKAECQPSLIFSVGNRVTIQGEVIYNRQARLEEIVDTAFSGFSEIAVDVKQDRLSWGTDTSQYPNPLHLYPTILNQTLEGRKSMVHGDLHMRNILVDQDRRGWLIDFARVTARHNLYDFIKLETCIRQMILSHERLQFPFLSYLKFEEALTATSLGISATIPEHPDLRKAYQVIQAVREIAAQYMRDPTSFYSEYFPALFLYNLAVLKYYDNYSNQAARLAFTTATVVGKALIEPERSANTWQYTTLEEAKKVASAYLNRVSDEQGADDKLYLQVNHRREELKARSESRYKPGDKIGGRYQVHQVKMGGVGEVYLCLDQEERYPYALKTFQSHLIDRQLLRKAFEQEIACWVALERHPSIVRCFFMDILNNQPFIFLEWIASDESRGNDLRSWLQRGPLELRLALDFTIDICRGLIHAHERQPGIVHRDLKPENILLTQERLAKITDFGLAKIIQGTELEIPSDPKSEMGRRQSLVGQYNIVGTTPYMPPEQWQGEPFDTCADIYAIGCIFYEMLTGSRPFKATTLSNLRRQHLEAKIPKLPKDLNLYDSLDAVLARCLAKRHEERFVSADELLEVLLQIYQQLFAESPRPLSPPGGKLTALDYINRGNTYRNLQRYTEALADYDQAIELDPKDAEFYFNRGVIYEELGRYDEALTDFKRVIDLEFNKNAKKTETFSLSSRYNLRMVDDTKTDYTLEAKYADNLEREKEKSTIKILFLAANPIDPTRLRLNEEIQTIDQTLRQTGLRNKFDIKQHWATRVSDLQEYLPRYKPDIVHFTGHGNKPGGIILKDDLGVSQPVSVHDLSQLFSVQKDNVRCVILNACCLGEQAHAIAEHIDCVIGVPTAVGDVAAISFVTAFYQALGYGKDLKTAFDLGSAQVKLKNLGDQDTPKLLATNCDPEEIVLVNLNQ